MLLAVAGFGIFTIIFAFSSHMWLSLFALAMTGACDSISVVVRQTILQIFHPKICAVVLPRSMACLFRVVMN
jgi:hypothetical protein